MVNFYFKQIIAVLYFNIVIRFMSLFFTIIIMTIRYISLIFTIIIMTIRNSNCPDNAQKICGIPGKKLPQPDE